MELSKREYQKGRRALGVAVAAALKQTARADGWRISKGWLFKERDGWFLEVRSYPWIVEDRTTAEFRAKPMALDPVFWQIVQTPENINQPLSFRLFGAWTCRGPAWSETSISEDDGADDIAFRILDWASAQIKDPPLPFETNALIKFITDRPERRGFEGGWLAEVITLLMLAGRSDEARSLCMTAINSGESGGYTVGSKSFPQLALDWIEGHAGRIEPLRPSPKAPESP